MIQSHDSPGSASNTPVPQRSAANHANTRPRPPPITNRRKRHGRFVLHRACAATAIGVPTIRSVIQCASTRPIVAKRLSTAKRRSERRGSGASGRALNPDQQRPRGVERRHPVAGRQRCDRHVADGEAAGRRQRVREHIAESGERADHGKGEIEAEADGARCGEGDEDVDAVLARPLQDIERDDPTRQCQIGQRANDAQRRQGREDLHRKHGKPRSERLFKGEDVEVVDRVDVRRQPQGQRAGADAGDQARHRGDALPPHWTLRYVTAEGRGDHGAEANPAECGHGKPERLA